MKSLRAKKQGKPVTYRRTYPFLHLPWSHLLRPGISGRHHQRLWKIVSLGGVYAYLECHGTSTWCNPSCLILKFQETSICLSWVVFSCFFQKQMETTCKIWSPKDVIAFNTVIVACGKGQRWRDALELMKQLEDHGLLPTVVTYSSVMTWVGGG